MQDHGRLRACRGVAARRRPCLADRFATVYQRDRQRLGRIPLSVVANMGRMVKSLVQTFARSMVRIVYPALFALALMPTTGNAQGPIDPEKWLKEAEDAYGSVTNYTAILHKQQRVEGKLLQEETILIKFRRPFSLYMRWIAAPGKGSEVLYVQGWNDNRAKAHEGGFLRFITLNLDPKDPRLMADNLRPLTDTGIGCLVKIVTVNVRKAIKAGELGFHDRGEQTTHGRKTRRREVVFPREKVKGYDAYRMIVNQDIESKILVGIEMYDWNDQLFENYGYEDLKPNAGLTDADFDPENPEYNF